MKSNCTLSYDDQHFIAEKQKQIRKNASKKKEIRKKINELLEEVAFLDADIDSYRYSIRKKLGRE